MQGDYYIVNGVKKFISAGTHADYFTTAVRTGGEGMNGVSLLLIDKTMAGVTARKMEMQGWWCSGTALVAFDEVKVPVSHLIGKENDGFRPIMVNFNHERFVIGANANRYARVCLEESIKFARTRVTFGKPLIQHPVRYEDPHPPSSL
jgi:alkylation response protein AidB-like acyl-CoA dehydrogenase